MDILLKFQGLLQVVKEPHKVLIPTGALALDLVSYLNATVADCKQL